MLFCSKTISEVVTSTSTVDAEKIRLGAGYRLPDVTADAGKIRLGAGYRLPDVTA